MRKQIQAKAKYYVVVLGLEIVRIEFRHNGGLMHINGDRHIEKERLANFTYQKYPVLIFESTSRLYEMVVKSAVTAQKIEVG